MEFYRQGHERLAGWTSVTAGAGAKRLLVRLENLPSENHDLSARQPLAESSLLLHLGPKPLELVDALCAALPKASGLFVSVPGKYFRSSQWLRPSGRYRVPNARLCTTC